MDTTADSGAKVAEARAQWAKHSRDTWISAVVFLAILAAIGIALSRHWWGAEFDLKDMAVFAGLCLIWAPLIHGREMRDFEEKLARRRAAGLEE